jgi:IS5 family transposase
MKQQDLSMSEDRSASFQRAEGRQTKRELFLKQMDQIVPWAQLTALIQPHYPKAGNGRAAHRD